jgi:hypothetical protein
LNSAVSAAAVLPAHAQVTVDMTMITCEQYVLFAMGDPKDINMWLSGYFSAKREACGFVDNASALPTSSTGPTTAKEADN